MSKLLLVAIICCVPFQQAALAQAVRLSHQGSKEDQVARNLESLRISASLPRLNRVPASQSELQLTCTVAHNGKEVRDPELGNLFTYVTSDLASQPERLELVALGTSDFSHGGPRRPVYSDKGWPRYSVIVFIDEMSTPENAMYRVGVARRPSAFLEWISPVFSDNPIHDAKDWKAQVIPACQQAR